jgi:3-hydroxyacyl-CoA dehydrogenase/enoyl-CoA hydratase/3-hydroxybutyryl-CoA epimerase
MGVLAAMPLMLTGRNVLSRQAKKMGLTDLCVPLRQLKASAIQTALRKPPKQQAPKSAMLLEAGPMRKLVAMQMRKQVASKAKQEHYPAPYALINIWEMHGSKSNDMYAAEAESVAQLAMTETAQNLVRVFFLQNRLKALGDKSLFSPKHVHVIGGGVMGGDIAAWCAMQGFKVTIQDLSQDALGRVVGRAVKGFKRRYRKDKLRIMSAQDNLIPDIHGHGISKADVIIEAIFENLEAKQKIFKDVEAKAKPDAIIATNTSSITLNEIAGVMKNPERLVGLHFFNPVFKMPLLEIIYTPDKTDPKIIELAQSFGAHIGKLPLPVKSSPGFLINRILMPYILEGVTIHQEGVPAAVVDKVAVDYGMPMGPLELADTVGLDICLHVGKILADKVGVTLPTTLDSEVESGRLGKKSGQGFYNWKADKKIKEKNAPKWGGDLDQLEKRLIDKFLNESQKCLDEGLVEDADLLDAGVIFGTGFAPFRGGPMNVIKNAG